MTLSEALSILERQAGIAPPLGSQDIPPARRYAQVLQLLRSKLCGHSAAIRKRLKTEEANLAATIIDVLSAAFTGLPVPIATVSKSIAAIGIDRFCSDPSAIVNGNEQ